MFSDHESLSYLNASKINSGRLARIIEQLSDYDFTIEYKKGTSGVISVADALSRLPRFRNLVVDREASDMLSIDIDTSCTLVELLGIIKPTTTTRLSHVMETFNMGVDSYDHEFKDDIAWGISMIKPDENTIISIQEGYKQDEFFNKIVNTLIEKEDNPLFLIPKEMRFTCSKYVWNKVDKLLYKYVVDGVEKLCIPQFESLRLNILLNTHETPVGGHAGRDKTLARIAKDYYWPGLVKDVDDFVKSCSTCQRIKSVKRAPLGLLYPHTIPLVRWNTITLDFIVALPKTKEGGFDAILTVVDALSKRVHLIATHSNINAIQTAQLLRENVIKYHGYPRKIISDRGSIFVSDIWKELFRCLRSTQNLSSSYHPQTDGLSEKMNESAEVCLRAFTNYLQNDWNIYLPDIELGMNTSRSDSSGLSPHEIDTGSMPFLPLGIADHLVNLSETNPGDINSFITKINLVMNRARIMMLESQEQSSFYANKHRTDIEFLEGDFVMLNAEFVYDPIHLNRPSRKFSDKWLRSFQDYKKNF